MPTWWHWRQALNHSSKELQTRAFNALEEVKRVTPLAAATTPSGEVERVVSHSLRSGQKSRSQSIRRGVVGRLFCRRRRWLFRQYQVTGGCKPGQCVPSRGFSRQLATVFTLHVEVECVAPARSPKEPESSTMKEPQAVLLLLDIVIFAVLKFIVIFVIHIYISIFRYRVFYVYCLYILLKPLIFGCRLRGRNNVEQRVI